VNSLSSEVAGTETDFQDSVIDELSEKGLIDRGSYLHVLRERKYLTLGISFVLSLTIFIVPLLLMINQANSVGTSRGFVVLDKQIGGLMLLPLLALTWAVCYWFCNLTAYIYFRNAGLPTGATSLARHMWAEILGYREYVKTVEYNRLLADNSLADPSYPYCIAFGLDPGVVDAIKDSQK
jgi:hypothetical protein